MELGEVEISIEANPDTVDGEVLQELRNAGFNRLSLCSVPAGRDLAILGRSYDVRPCRAPRMPAWRASPTSESPSMALPAKARRTGETLEGALELEVEHISCYCCS